MLRTRIVTLAFVVLAAMTSVAGIAVAAAPKSGPNPNKPVVETVDITFPASNMTAQCGFDVSVHVYGTITFKFQSNGVLMEKYRYDHTFIGPGGSFTVKHTENVKYTAVVLEDGSIVETIRASGTLLYHTVIPGHGTVGNNSGHEIIQFTSVWNETTGEYELVDTQILHDGGSTNGLGAEDFELLCGLLA